VHHIFLAQGVESIVDGVLYVTIMLNNLCV